MSILLRSLTIGILAFALAACGKTEDQKAQAHAEDLHAADGALSNYLSTTTPSPDWTDQELDAYSHKIDHFEAVDIELKRMTGTHGITVSGGNNGPFIEGRRYLVKLCRDQKKADKLDSEKSDSAGPRVEPSPATKKGKKPSANQA